MTACLLILNQITPQRGGPVHTKKMKELISHMKRKPGQFIQLKRKPTNSSQWTPRTWEKPQENERMNWCHKQTPYAAAAAEYLRDGASFSD